MNPATALARVLVDELARCGVTEAVFAPGSRSGPLALALLDEPRIRVHVRIDERSASYLAVGLARGSGRPAVLVSTSGTAAATFAPAVVEADAGGVPMLVLTADRPPELRGTGANQTIDQLGLFGTAVRLFTEVGVPAAQPGQVRYWRSLAGRAHAAAADGPVHLNVAFREPLIPETDRSWPESLDGRPGGAPWVRVRPRPEPPAESLRDVLGGPVPQRGAVVVGDGAVDPEAAVRLAESAGWPLLAEPTSGARRGPNAVGPYPLLLAEGEFAAQRAEVVVTVGRPGLSRALLEWVSRAGSHVVVDPRASWADPTRTAQVVLPAVPTVPERRSGPWLRRWRAAAAAATAAADAVLDDAVLDDAGLDDAGLDDAGFDDAVPGGGVLTEPAVARDLAAVLPPGALLVTGPSRPVRDLDAYLRPREGLRVLANRGVNGIDGVVSTAFGAALAHQRAGGGPAAALLGDLTYLHDRNGFVLGPDEARPDLVVVVIDNDGGGIFSTLPQAPGSAPGSPAFERAFGTPHGVDLAADAAAAGIDCVEVTGRAGLAAALRPAGGLRLVRVRTDREATAALHERVAKAVGAALAG